MRTKLDLLFRAEPPWIVLGHGETERMNWNASHFYSRPDTSVCVRVLRGHKMRSTGALMDEFAAALQFFDGFGVNWYALEDCLSCLDEWLPAEVYVLVIERAEELLADEDQQELATMLKILGAVGEYWAQPIEDHDRFDRGPIPFHTLVNLPDSGSADRIAGLSSDLEIAFHQDLNSSLTSDQENHGPS